MNKTIWIPTALLFIGVTLLSVGLFIPNYVDQVVNETVSKEAVVTNGSKVVNSWSKSKATVHVNYYLFNLTNREDVEGFGEKPLFQELGPYVYLKTREQIIHGWHENETLMDYETIERYYFDPILSNGSLDDSITTLNIPVVSIVQIVQNIGFIRKSVISAIRSSGEGLTITTTIGKLLFDGYEIPAARKFMKLGSLFKDGVKAMDRFSIFYQKNGSSSGIKTVRTGLDDIRSRFEIEKWNDQSSIPCWSDSRGGTCQMINGSDGTLGPALLSRNEPLYNFAYEINRSVHLDYVEDSEYQGIPTYTFVLPATTFSDQSEDDCFCINNETEITENGFCTLAGVMKLSSCHHGTPLVVSHPHFLNGDPLLLSSLKGLSPDPKIHETFMQIEPLLGIPMRFSKKIQMNLDLKRVKGFPDYPNMIFPIFWFDEHGTVDDEVINQLKEELYNKLNLAQTISIGSVSLGIILILLSILTLLYYVLIPKVRVNRQKVSKKTQIGLKCHYNPVENSSNNHNNNNSKLLITS